MRNLLTTVAMGLALGGVAMSAQADTTYPKMKMKMGHFLPATFAQADVDQWFADEVKKRSNGAIEVEIYWAGSMGNASELLNLVGSGAVDFAAFPVSYYPRQFGLTNVGSLPRNFSDVGRAHAALSKVYKMPKVQEEHRKNNVTLMMSHYANPYRVACNKSVATLAGMQGYRIRSVGEYIPIVYKAAGFVPVNTPANEVYESLEKGNLNCTLLSYDQMFASKIYEVAKFASGINFGALSTWQIWASNSTFNKLPKSVQKLLQEVGEEATARDVSAAQEALNKAVPALTAKGVSFVELANPSEFAERVPSALDLWAKKMKSTGQEEVTTEIMTLLKPETAMVK